MSSNGEAAGPASGQSGSSGSGYVPAEVVEVALEHVVAESPWGRFRLVFADLDDPAGPADADCGPASEAELLRRLAAAEGLVTQLLGRQSADLLALRELRLVTQRDYAPDGHDVQACTRGCCDPDGWIGLEVAHTLAVSERQVAARLETAEHLARFPHLRAAVERGLVQAWTAAKLGEHLAELAGLVDAQRLAQIEADTVAWLTDRPRSVGAVNARMRRVILRARAEAGLDCPRRDARDRRVWVEPAHTGGLATLIARLPAPDAIAVRETLTALAAEATGPDDQRTRDQRRADLLTTLVTGAPATDGHHDDLDLLVRGLGHVQVQLTVTVPADTLTGGPTPAEVPGYGPIPAATARDLAGTATRCRALVYHPATGHLLGLSTLTTPDSNTDTPQAGPPMRWLADQAPAAGYAHPPVTERLVASRDHTCRAPGCTRPATTCDCDHVTPWPRGETSAANTCCLCRRHHRLKTHAPGWAVTLDDHGTLCWTTPTGTTLTTHPHDYRPDDLQRSGPDGSADPDPPDF